MSLLDEFRVGSEARYESNEPLGSAAARYYALATEFPWRDEVPPTLIFDTNQLFGLPADEDGFAGHKWADDGDTLMIRARHSYELLGDVPLDERISCRWELVSATDATKPGGAERVRIESQATYERLDGEAFARQVEVMFIQRKGRSRP